MCGIAGFIDLKNRLDRQHLEAMTSSIGHRGPDDFGLLVVDSPYARVGLGHRRLSILDLSPLGHQPMSFNNYHLIFNGEIYNFKEIKKELEEKGHTFKSNSDTEVILKSFIEWREKCVDRFIGMFVFCVYDANEEKIYIYRDRAGVKPLYYYWSHDCFLFASELKAFHKIQLFEKQIEKHSLKLYLDYGYIPTPHTIFKHTFKLEPGFFLRFDVRKGSFERIKYWDVADFYNKDKLAISSSDATDEMEQILISAFKYRMVADVPVGVFLSGGYDSSIVTGILQKHTNQQIKTFSIGFAEKQFNEAPHAKAVSEYLGTDHTEYYCTAEEAAKILPKLPYMYDEPFGDSSAIPTTLVSQLAVQQVKVALSADAGDETFAGYSKYDQFFNYYNQFNKVPFSVSQAVQFGTTHMRPILTKLFSNAYNIDTRIYKIQELLKNKRDVGAFIKVLNQAYGEFELDNMLVHKGGSLNGNNFFDTVIEKHNDAINTMLAIDYKTYLLDDILTKVDRATMSVSLEGREPLLDHRIIEFAARLPSEFKLNKGITKFMLKEIAHKYIPSNLLNRPKMGFAIPVEIWLKDSLKPLIEHYFEESRIRKAGIFKPHKVVQMKNDFLAGRKFNINKLWSLLMFEMWYEYWME